MFEFRAAELKRGDTFTVDDGETWWKVLETKKDGKSVDVHSECVQSNEGDSRVGYRDWYLFLGNDPVIVM